MKSTNLSDHAANREKWEVIGKVCKRKAKKWKYKVTLVQIFFAHPCFTTCVAHPNLICLSVCLCVTKRIFFCRPLNLKWKIDSRPPLLNYYSTKILNLDIIVKFRILKIMKLRDFLRQIKPLCPSVCLSVRSWLFSHSNSTQIQ